MAMRYYAPLPGGGDPFWPRGPHVMRIGDAERDAAAADLGEHFTAGRLSIEELHERLEAVFAAKTFGQLARIMSDLPGPGRLPGLARLSRQPATPGMPSRPWMPAPAPGYSWAGDWNAGMRGSAMGSTTGRIPARLARAAGREVSRPRCAVPTVAGRPGGQVRRPLAADPGHADLAVHRPAVRPAWRSGGRPDDPARPVAAGRCAAPAPAAGKITGRAGGRQGSGSRPRRPSPRPRPGRAGG